MAIPDDGIPSFEHGSDLPQIDGRHNEITDARNVGIATPVGSCVFFIATALKSERSRRRMKQTRKNSLALMMVWILCLSLLAGCKEPAVKREKQENVLIASRVEGKTETPVTLTENQIKELLSMVNSDGWFAGSSLCACDAVFGTEGGTYRYSASCGTLLDEATCQGRVLSDAEKSVMDSLFGLSSSEAREHADRLVLWIQEYGYAPFVESKEISGTDRETILQLLSQATETGEVTEALSDGPFGQKYGLRADPYTVWIEACGALYRATPDFSELYRVETHLGAGKKLTVSDELRNAVLGAYFCAPRSGRGVTYHYDSNTIETVYEYDADAEVDIEILGVAFPESVRYFPRVRMRVTARKDVTFHVSMAKTPSGCIITDPFVSSEMTLKAGESRTFSLRFEGKPSGTYYMSIYGGGTQVRLKITH